MSPSYLPSLLLCFLASLLPSFLPSLFTYLLAYLCLSLPVEHTPSATPHHRALFWAALAIPDQLVPCCFSSASVSRLQLLRGRPLSPLSLPLRVPGQGLACGAGCWLLEGVFVAWLLASLPSNLLVYLGNGCAQAVA